MQQYAGIYLLQNYSTYFGCLTNPSSRVNKNVTGASDTMTCSRSCSYSFMYSWWWVR